MAKALSPETKARLAALRAKWANPAPVAADTRTASERYIDAASVFPDPRDPDSRAQMGALWLAAGMGVGR